MNSANKSAAFVFVCMKTQTCTWEFLFLCAYRHTHKTFSSMCQGINLPDNFCTCTKCHREVILQFEGSKQGAERENKD